MQINIQNGVVSENDTMMPVRKIFLPGLASWYLIC